MEQVYDKTKKYLEGLEPSLVPYFYKNLGYSMGVELVESYGTIKSGSEVVVEYVQKERIVMDLDVICVSISVQVLIKSLIQR